jgi:hypothetical protein
MSKRLVICVACDCDYPARMFKDDAESPCCGAWLRPWRECDG